jgi:hypothetical protein
MNMYFIYGNLIIADFKSVNGKKKGGGNRKRRKRKKADSVSYRINII